MKPTRFTFFWIIFAALLVGASMAGCVVYEPVPMYQPAGSNFDRAWNAALGAVQDAGVRMTSAEPANGLIRGTRNGIEVFVTVARQADGSVRVAFTSKGRLEEDPNLGERFSGAFDRRMGY